MRFIGNMIVILAAGIAVAGTARLIVEWLR